MKYQPPILETPPHATYEHCGLCRFTYFGGPFDGLVSSTDALPMPSQELETGTPDLSRGRSSPALQRVAQYRWKSTQLIKDQGLPVVVVHYTYRGTVTFELKKKQPVW